MSETGLYFLLSWLGVIITCRILVSVGVPLLGVPVVPFYPFVGEDSPTDVDCRNTSSTLILTSKSGGPS